VAKTFADMTGWYSYWQPKAACFGMISPTGSGTSPSTPTVSSRPGTNCSAMTSASYARASVTAASNPSALRTRDMPTDEPMLEGFTITGQPRAVVTSSGATGGG